MDCIHPTFDNIKLSAKNYNRKKPEQVPVIIGEGS